MTSPVQMAAYIDDGIPTSGLLHTVFALAKACAYSLKGHPWLDKLYKYHAYNCNPLGCDFSKLGQTSNLYATY